MKRVERFSLVPYEAPHEEGPERSKLLVDGRPTSTKVPGYEILHQFEIPAGYLLATDFDCPFEETVNLILLDHNYRLVSYKSIGATFSFVPNGTTYLLKDIEWIDDWHFVTIPFGEDDERYRLTIRPWGIPYIYPRLVMQQLQQ